MLLCTDLRILPHAMPLSVQAISPQSCYNISSCVRLGVDRLGRRGSRSAMPRAPRGSPISATFAPPSSTGCLRAITMAESSSYRIEDTDQNRLVEGAVEAILEGLRWLNVDWDEGPEVDGPPRSVHEQSQRLEFYQRLTGTASRPEATPTIATAAGRNWSGCAGPTARLGRRETAATAVDSGRERRSWGCLWATTTGWSASPCPESGVTRVHDLIRGEVEWRNEIQEDFVILKSDGFPDLPPCGGYRRPPDGDQPRHAGPRSGCRALPVTCS